jgi:hypothetical protein
VDLDFSGIKVNDFVSVPEGSYLCRIAEVVPGVTRNGHDRWGLRLVVAEGEHVGRQAAWDGIVFSERGMHRARRVFAALGLPTEGKIRVEPEDLAGREVFVTVRPQEYRDPVTDEVTRRNEVPYDGYRSVHGSNGEPRDPAPADGRELPDDDPIPF